jgi:hypothetical protein
MKVNTDTGIISAQGYMEEELSNELRPLVKSMLQKVTIALYRYQA